MIHAGGSGDVKYITCTSPLLCSQLYFGRSYRCCSLHDIWKKDDAGLLARVHTPHNTAVNPSPRPCMSEALNHDSGVDSSCDLLVLSERAQRRGN